MQQRPFPELDEVYRSLILERYKNPRNKVQMEEPDIEYDEFNPVCGDQVVLQLKLDDGRIRDASFHGEGCSISQSSASIMTDLLKGKTLEEAEGLSETFRRMMQGQAPSTQELGELGKLEVFQGVRKFPVRIKCALLGWTALEEGIEEFRGRGAKPELALPPTGN